ncbi:hypothetical protein [Paenimyroides ceti]
MWYDKTEIPADKSTWGSFDDLLKIRILMY